MYLVQQISRYHCFPACLVSFFRDLQLSLEQDEIVNRCPNLFHKGNDIEGSITNSDENLNQVANEFNIQINTNLENGEIQISANSTVFIFLRWKNNPADNHCVRFYKQEDKYTYFMNPTCGIIDKENSSVLNTWVTKVILITKR